MASVVSSLSQWFWNDHVWLPPGYTWSSFNSPQLTNNETVIVQPGDFAKFSDLLYPLPLALCVILVRLVIQRTLLRPLATRLGLKSRRRPYHTHNDKLETAFRRGLSEAPYLGSPCTAVTSSFTLLLFRGAPLKPSSSRQHQRLPRKYCPRQKSDSPNQSCPLRS